jgi:hypothetical protein
MVIERIFWFWLCEYEEHTQKNACLVYVWQAKQKISWDAKICISQNLTTKTATPLK